MEDNVLSFFLLFIDTRIHSARVNVRKLEGDLLQEKKKKTEKSQPCDMDLFKIKTKHTPTVHSPTEAHLLKF